MILRLSRMDFFQKFCFCFINDHLNVFFMFWNESEIWNGIMHQYILLSHIVLVPYGWKQTHTQLEMVHAVDNIIESQRFTNSHRMQTTDKTMLAWMIFMGFKNYAVKCGRKFTGATRQLFALVFCFVILHCRWECNMMFWRVQLNLILSLTMDT